MSRRSPDHKPSLGRAHVIASLLGPIPVLMLLLSAGTSGRTLPLAAAASLGLVVVGYRMLLTQAKRWASLADQSGKLNAGGAKGPLSFHGDPLQESVANHINSLQAQVVQAKREYADLSVKLMVYANDLEFYQKKIHAEESLRAMLSRYVGHNVVQKLMHGDVGMPLQNEQRQVTILFADIRSFTSISESMQPQEVVEMLNEFFGAMVDVIFRHHGVLDKFIGDQIMALFGVLPCDNAPSQAVAAAIEMQESLRRLMAVRAGQGKPTFHMGIGINTGEVIVGNVGADNRMDYTVIGDAVNVAARLERVAGADTIIVGEASYPYCRDHFQLRKRDDIKVKNRHGSVASYEVVH